MKTWSEHQSRYSPAARSVLPCSYHVLTSSVRYQGTHVFQLFTRLEITFLSNVTMMLIVLERIDCRFESLDMELQERVDDKMWLVKHLERTRQRVLDDLIVVKVCSYLFTF